MGTGGGWGGVTLDLLRSLVMGVWYCGLVRVLGDSTVRKC